MKFPLVKVILFCAFGQLATLAPHASAQLKAGAARIDITPDLADLPKPFVSIGSNLYARALVLENDRKRVIFVVGDSATIDSQIFDDLIQRIATAGGAPVENVILAVTHTHSSVRLANDGMGAALPGSTKIARMTQDRMVQCVQQAVANLQPARAGYATGAFHLATSRGWMEQPGVDQGRSADAATIGVFKVEGTTGDPIALMINGGPEPTMGGPSSNTRIGGDLAGVAARYLEQRLGDKAVVLYTIGSPPQLVVDARKRIPGVEPADQNVLNALMNAVGSVLGEEALLTAVRIKTTSDLPVSGAVKVLTCPGKATTPLNNSNSCSDAPGSQLPRCIFTDHDNAPANLRVGVIHLGDLSVVDADSDIDSTVWAEVRNQAPNPANTMLVALSYGPMHYVEPDSAYASNSYSVTATMVKSGCAEKGFVNDALGMLLAGANGAK